MALRKLAAQAHGESLTHLLAAWEARQADLVPTAQDLGRNVNAAARAAWSQAVSQAPSATAGEAILRLEMAAEVPTPAENLNERRALQLQLLTRKTNRALSKLGPWMSQQFCLQRTTLKWRGVCKML